MRVEDSIIRAALTRFYEHDMPDTIPDSLPLVEQYAHSSFSPTTFSDMEVLFIQHHLGPLIPRIKTMFEYGLDPSSCWFIDIPYSTCRLVVDELLKLGVPKEQTTSEFDDPLAPYSRRQYERSEFLLRQLAAKNESRVLIIDDGAYFIRTLNHFIVREPQLVNGFKERGTFLVEQTTRGHRYLQSNAGKKMLDYLEIPVVSIARCKTKYILEGPFIGAAVARKAVSAFSDYSNSFEKGLVIGFGPVGAAITKEMITLHPDADVQVYDIKWEQLGKSIQELGAVPLQSFPESGEYETVFGSTGYASFPVEKTDILADDAMLMSGSSAAIEFNREKFIELAYLTDEDDFFVVAPERTRLNGIHANIELVRDDKRFTFLNAGFPINFDGQIECVPSEIIQVTHTLLLAASFDALTNPRPGFRELDLKFDNWALEEGMKAINNYAT